MFRREREGAPLRVGVEHGARRAAEARDAALLDEPRHPLAPLRRRAGQLHRAAPALALRCLGREVVDAHYGMLTQVCSPRYAYYGMLTMVCLLWYAYHGMLTVVPSLWLWLLSRRLGGEVMVRVRVRVRVRVTLAAR